MAYVLGATEEEVEQWFANEGDDFGSPQQTHALRQLHVVLHAHGDSDPGLRQFNLSRILGLYQSEQDTTLVNVLRMIATGEAFAPVVLNEATEALALLVRDAYPLYLLPEDGSRFPHSFRSLYQHPTREAFETLALREDAFVKLFPKGDEHLGDSASTLRSTGQGGGVQLSMLAETLIGSGWNAARMHSSGLPSLHAHTRSTIEQLDTLRSALQNKTAKVPVRIAFTGVLLNSDEPIDLGWGILRKLDSRDHHLVPRSTAGKLSGAGTDGVTVTIDYGGEVILDTTLEYRIQLKDLLPGDTWPVELRGYERTQELTECIQLGALLSQEPSAQETVMVIPAWFYTHDPLAQGLNMSWNDVRSGKGFIPKQIDANTASAWKEFTVAVEANRTKYVDVAIRRTLRASVERRDPSDVLVDAIIAWENLFGSRKGESTLRICGSLAWLLEADKARRFQLRSELGKLYDARSNVVHGNKELASSELVPQAQRALAVAIDALRVMFTSRLDLLNELKTGDDRSNRLLMGG